MAVIAPSGTAAIVIISVISAVPTMAGKIPPWVIPSVGNSVGNFQERVFHPPDITMTKMDTIMKRIKSTLVAVIPVTMASQVCRFIRFMLFSLKTSDYPATKIKLRNCIHGECENKQKCTNEKKHAVVCITKDN